jgi:N12 class adenine-specific DNA methylase
MAFLSGKKLADNIEAIRIALDYSGGILSNDQLERLKAYAGFGGIKAILYPDADVTVWQKAGVSAADIKLNPGTRELHLLLTQKLAEKDYKNAFESLKNSSLTAYFTPDFIPSAIYAAMAANGLVPKRLYEPSAGAGAFILSAKKVFPGVAAQAVEKDWLTGKVLTALLAGSGIAAEVSIKALEETGSSEKGIADLVASNIPFGNFAVNDPVYNGSPAVSKIHNYFFVKGLDKLADGGLLAYITTDGFLNSPSNESARKHLFTSADLISVSVLPANLMKDSSGVEVGTHLVIVQKNDRKEQLSATEAEFIVTVELTNSYGKYHYNAYLNNHLELCLGDELIEGRNLYGDACRTVWQNGEMELIGNALQEQLLTAFKKVDQQKFLSFSLERPVLSGKSFTFKPLPVADTKKQKEANGGAQLGLFDAPLSVTHNKADLYLMDIDRAIIDAASTKIISTIRTTARPAHESILLLTARSLSANRYLYKLISNVSEINFSTKWLNGQSLGNELDQLAVRLKGFAYDYRYEGDSTLESAFKIGPDRPKKFTDILPYYVAGTLVIFEGKTGVIGEPKDFEAAFKPLELQQDLSFYSDYINLRDTYLQLFGYESEQEIEYPSLREELNKNYDSFQANYGTLSEYRNRNRILQDAAFGFRLISSLEVKRDERLIKADIFSGPLFFQKNRLLTDDPAEALARCMNDHGKVILSEISASTGLNEQELIRRLDRQIILNPLSGTWETVDKYLSGNVVAKLAIAKQHSEAEPENIEYARSYAAISRVQPEKIPFELLDFNLGERWVLPDYYERFASDLFKLPVTINYFPSVDTFKVDYRHGNAVTDGEFTVIPKSGPGNKITAKGLLEHALENTSPYITYTVKVDGKDVRIPDNEAIQDAHRKIEKIRERYTEWLRSLPAEDKDALERQYNETFNCYVLREYDGSHLRFPGLDKNALGISDLYSSQKNAAWRLIQNRGGLIDHEVGLGKTLTMIIAAVEMKRLGMIGKPMILALKANVDQIRDTFRMAYPKAKVLAPGENDYTPAKRQRLFQEIKNNNWDCIILTHDQFGMIPQSPEIQREIFQTELDNLSRDLFTLESLGAELSRKMLKGLEIRKANLQASLNAVVYAIENRKDTGVNFQEMGVDHLFIDESHKFKNLTFTTRHNRVAGLGNTAGSQKALNMLFAIRTLQDKFKSDLCVTFLSGTPISNSLTEMYLIFKYLRPNELERQSISNFDAWAAVFARKTADFEFTVTNEIKSKERFRYFIKVPELALFYNEITDYKTAKHIGLDKPEGLEQLVNIPPTPDQQDFIKRLMAFAQTGEARYIFRRELTGDEDKGRMLIATNYAKKMAVDLRLIDDHRYRDHPGNKVSVCAANIARIYRESTANKGTQIVFSDIGTPKDAAFNVYSALREKLVVEYGLPRHEITFIHEWPEKRKKDLFRMMDAGEIRLLLGSTEKAGTGLNVQKRMAAMHHLDIPWKPSELDQRNGRGARQGNWFAKTFLDNKIPVYYYAVEQSLDNYKFNLLKNKQTFISQMKNNELTRRTLDEGALDEDGGMNFSEYIAVLSGDTSLLEKTKTEKRIAVMEGERTAHFRDVVRAKDNLEQLKKKIVETDTTLGRLQTDFAAYKGKLTFEQDGSKANPIQLSGFSSAETEKIGSKIIQLYQKWRPASGNEGSEKIGELYGFELYVRRQRGDSIAVDGSLLPTFQNSLYAESPMSGIKYLQNEGAPNSENPKLAARYFLNAIDRVGYLTDKYGKELDNMRNDVPLLTDMTQKTFDKEQDLIALKADLRRLDDQINKNIAEKQKEKITFDLLIDEKDDFLEENTVVLSHKR